jgi:hypothetical protein
MKYSIGFASQVINLCQIVFVIVVLYALWTIIK